MPRELQDPDCIFGLVGLYSKEQTPNLAKMKEEKLSSTRSYIVRGDD